MTSWKENTGKTKLGDKIAMVFSQQVEPIQIMLMHCNGGWNMYNFFHCQSFEANLRQKVPTYIAWTNLDQLRNSLHVSTKRLASHGNLSWATNPLSGDVALSKWAEVRPGSPSGQTVTCAACMLAVPSVQNQDTIKPARVQFNCTQQFLVSTLSVPCSWRLAIHIFFYCYLHTMMMSTRVANLFPW